MDNSKFIEYAMGISNSYNYVEDLDSKTKAQLKALATSINLSVSTSLTKAQMIEAIRSSTEYHAYIIGERESRKSAFERSFYEKYPDGYNV